MAFSSERLCAKRKTSLLVCILQVVTVTVCLVPSGTALTSEGLALLDFKKQVNDRVGILRSWNISDISPCNWRGIVCNNFTNRVVTVNLPRSSFNGTISPQLGTLSELRRLGLHFNKLTGVIPASLGNLTYLRELYLHNNSLTGALPDSLGLLPKLRVLDVSFNNLEGAVPESYINLTSRKFLWTGNHLLCGNPLLGLPACPSENLESNPVGHVPRNPWSVWKILLVSVGAFLFFKLIIGLLLLRRWLRDDKKREIDLGKGGKLVMFKGGSTVPTSREMLRVIRRITKKDVIGEGGFGKVYKITLKDNTSFAVKKLKHCLEAARGFENELETLGEIKHCNLVKLRGYCVAPLMKLLIYDFVPNGTLDELLHPHTEIEKLYPVDWPTRVRVALGVARALAYIHHSCEPRIVHRDISANNVLLDENFEPRLSDFGLAKLLNSNDTHATVTVAGTFGYVSPEYAKTGQATEKSDVYSYGVLLLEILSGRRPTDSSISEEHVNLAGWVRNLQENCQEFEMVEKRWRDTVPHRELALFMEIACRCVSLEPSKRPRMDKVAHHLERLMDCDSTSSVFTLSNNTSTRTGHGRRSHDFLDISDLPGFRHDGHRYIIDMDRSP
ncbi:hypothetical protein M758_2G076700 [Ceratodon purpureus]|nr:hypothetical protein M758_2G076700 [Ceratodon purpureus]